MSDTASTSKVEVPTKVIEPSTHKDDDHPAALGVLEEDDEFEEFPVAGQCPSSGRGSMLLACILTDGFVDWDDSQTDLAHLKGSAPGQAKSGGDKLWEDNWDDDDIEDIVRSDQMQSERDP